MDRISTLLSFRYFRSFSLPWRYGVIGAILGLGSPYGLFLLRFFMTYESNFSDWWKEELITLKWIYLYTGLGSVFFFFLFGYVLGKRSEGLLKLTESLKQTTTALERLSITDGLTDLYVHSFIIKRLDEELFRAKRYHYPLSCLFIDIDDFKSLNDNYGHLLGDSVLIQISKIMMSVMRESDSLGRFGGDEFLVILPETNAKESDRIAERIRKGISHNRLTVDNKKIRTTVSVGVFNLKELPSTTKEILEMADYALHRAKRFGKNRIVHFTEIDKMAIIKSKISSNTDYSISGNN